MSELRWKCPKCGPVEHGLMDEQRRSHCPREGCDELLEWIPMLTAREKRVACAGDFTRDRKSPEQFAELVEKRTRAGALGHRSAAAGRRIMARVEARESGAVRSRARSAVKKTTHRPAVLYDRAFKERLVALAELHPELSQAQLGALMTPPIYQAQVSCFCRELGHERGKGRRVAR